uniref:TSA: Wollemia nobilis Ref_Wollemi_Transcript_5979_650 transcribed RNA sequence n=1 Tax=Wollemia nobilis TaxID=56998 RepID=A0A0C9RXF7_9CONI
MATNMSAPSLHLPLLSNRPQTRPFHVKPSPSLKRMTKQRPVPTWRAMAADPSYIDYKSSQKSVFPAEACDTVGGEACEGPIGTEVKAEAKAKASATSSSTAEGVDREYVEYDSSPKTVFPGEACDDLGGEFCEPEYQAGVFEEKQAQSAK